VGEGLVEAYGFNKTFSHQQKNFLRAAEGSEKPIVTLNEA
jgi:hypothetical protein